MPTFFHGNKRSHWQIKVCWGSNGRGFVWWATYSLFTSPHHPHHRLLLISASGIYTALLGKNLLEAWRRNNRRGSTNYQAYSTPLLYFLCAAFFVSDMINQSMSWVSRNTHCASLWYLGTDNWKFHPDASWHKMRWKEINTFLSTLYATIVLVSQTSLVSSSIQAMNYSLTQDARYPNAGRRDTKGWR